ncbi:alpha/beta fold hydrolase [Aerococcus urinae]|uniref:Alpha/beta fold hydrolase n=1 Tax=Aerococcus urinae TaxID=1376 RepID=A0A0X8FFI7_9LACT|nr:alpha/beta hydrolase [Aerococcus urinae]AMB96406.1 alpha/beta hydrolase [Aerococcus urinae]MCY3032223.1 alpha/beta hydrolase [Aerococcus urinae]MCY3037729.1 alpha/beta hydrolase [Aerococcus urinae]MCY3044269.1 alpha/beta hydrolase [Aerococcus urinae]MCY3045605.1 alpha/beta hydrolase [Aerococcus urinae]
MKNILIHGLGQDHTSWDPVKGHLGEENLAVHCPNLFELVKNDRYTYQNLYNQFETHINHYDSKVNLCGLSLGGLLALDYAKNYPNKVNSLILIGVPYKIPKLLMDIQAMIFRLMPKRTFEKLGLAKDEFVSLIASTKDLNIATNLEQVDCKTLLICGEKDRFNLKSSRHFHAQIKNSELNLIKNAGHEVNVDNPKVLAELISEFWKK